MARTAVFVLAAFCGVFFIQNIQHLQRTPAQETQTIEATRFRVLVKMFDENSPKPKQIAEHLILFDNDMIYGVPSDDEGQIVVIDQERDRIILLDRNSKQRSDIATSSLVGLTAKLRASATDTKLAERLGVNAKVDYDKSSEEYSVKYGQIAYQTTVQKPVASTIAPQFGEYVTWTSRLNVARPTGVPPLGRMRLNEKISIDGLIPKTTKLTISSGLTHTAFRSEYELVERINLTDKKMIGNVSDMLATFTAVPFKDFPR